MNPVSLRNQLLRPGLFYTKCRHGFALFTSPPNTSTSYTRNISAAPRGAGVTRRFQSTTSHKPTRRWSLVDEQDKLKIQELGLIFEKINTSAASTLPQLSSLLKTGDPVAEAEWTRLFSHLEQTPQLVYLKTREREEDEVPGKRYIRNRKEELVDEIV